MQYWLDLRGIDVRSLRIVMASDPTVSSSPVPIMLRGRWTYLLWFIPIWRTWEVTVPPFTREQFPYVNPGVLEIMDKCADSGPHRVVLSASLEELGWTSADADRARSDFTLRWGGAPRETNPQTGRTTYSSRSGHVVSSWTVTPSELVFELTAADRESLILRMNELTNIILGLRPQAH